MSRLTTMMTRESQALHNLSFMGEAQGSVEFSKTTWVEERTHLVQCVTWCSVVSPGGPRAPWTLRQRGLVQAPLCAVPAAGTQ